MELSTRLFEVGQDNECIGMIKGTLQLEDLFRMLNRLSESELREYFEITLEAVAIGAAPGLPPAPPAGDFAALMRDLMNTLSPADQGRFRTAAMTVHLGGEKDSCWFGKTMFAGLTSMPAASRTAVIMASTQAPPQSSPAPIQARRF